MEQKQTYPRYLDIQVGDKFKGLYTCHCHYFDSYDDLRQANLQKLKVGDNVVQRCSKKGGTISEIKDKCWCYIKKNSKEGLHGLYHISELQKQK